jgi:6-phosphogluconate dehydrogenase
MSDADIAVVGLAVMGRNLAFNMAEKGFKVALYNRSVERTDEAMALAGPLADRLVPCHTPEELVAAVKKPRAILLMVQAGAAVDETAARLQPLLDKGDALIDAGNANFHDTVRRESALDKAGLAYLGVGVSGGEEGARHGPSIMVGGKPEVYGRVDKIFTAIAAKFEGTPCCALLGTDGAGHFVKTIHNGIEYADMQMIGEVYGLLRRGLGLTPAEIGDVFERWSKGLLSSYLVDITATVLKTTDPKTGKPLVDVIVDSAGQKGTGRWSAIEALALGAPASSITAAVEARGVSAERALRKTRSERFPGAAQKLTLAGNREAAIELLEKALLAGKILAYTEGFAIMSAASREYGWKLPLAEVARIWRAGCIIRSTLLDRIASAYDQTPDIESLVLAPGLTPLFEGAAGALPEVVAEAFRHGHAVPALSAATSRWLALRQPRSTADLTQGQRDFFGAHGFGRIDAEGQHHGPWSQSGG